MGSPGRGRRDRHRRARSPPAAAPEFADLIKGKYADISNAPGSRKGSSITAAEFLKNFVGDTPWTHLDIAGTAWDLGRTYVGNGASGFGTRLLVELAREHGSA